MMCCVGLFTGFAVGQYLGGPWTFIAPAAGFGIGLAADMKFMKGHRHGLSRANPGPAPEKNVDPVCGMEVDENSTEHRLVHEGRTYYFCAAACRKAFEENPQKYLGPLRRAGCCG